MTREQQRQLKELKKALSQMIKDNVKQFQMKKKDFMIYSCRQKLYYSLLIDVVEANGHCYVISRTTIKPLWMDDLLWDIMNMTDNKQQPLSLRCIGAFAVHGMKLAEDRQELMDWSIEELKHGECFINEGMSFQDRAIHYCTLR